MPQTKKQRQADICSDLLQSGTDKKILQPTKKPQHPMVHMVLIDSNKVSDVVAIIIFYSYRCKAQMRLFNNS